MKKAGGLVVLGRDPDLAAIDFLRERNARDKPERLRVALLQRDDVRQVGGGWHGRLGHGNANGRLAGAWRVSSSNARFWSCSIRTRITPRCVLARVEREARLKPKSEGLAARFRAARPNPRSRAAQSTGFREREARAGESELNQRRQRVRNLLSCRQNFAFQRRTRHGVSSALNTPLDDLMIIYHPNPSRQEFVRVPLWRLR